MAAVTTIRRVDGSTGREPLFGVAATRRIEAEALRDAPAFTLMARAGDAVARLALALAPHAERVLVLAGPGNNGGDGLEAATRLRAFGKDAAVVLLGDPAALPADAAQAHARARAGGRSDLALACRPRATRPGWSSMPCSASAPRARPAATWRRRSALVASLAARGVPVLAVDVPSGLDPERGQPLGEACVVAQHTLALIGARPGLFTASGRDFAGTVWTDALGLDLDRHTPDAWLVGAGEIAARRQPRRHAEHKGSFGDVAIVGGAAGMAGAALLAARAAHAAGAGRVFVDLLDAGAARSRSIPSGPS